MPVALQGELDNVEAQATPRAGTYVEATLTALFTAAAVLLVSFVAVITGMV